MAKPVKAPVTNTRVAKATDENGHITRSVYLSPAITMNAFIARLETVSEAGIRLMSAMVVHIVNRTHPLVDEDKRTSKELDVEIERAITRYATGKNGKPFAHAWTAKLLVTGKRIAKAFEDDYTKSGYKGCVEAVLLSKSPDEANDVVYNQVMTLTKGANNLTAIVKVMNPPKVGHGNTGKTSNNVPKDAKGNPIIKQRADTAPAASVAARILGDTGAEVFKSLPKDKKSAEATAITLADNVGKGNLDRRVFILRSVTLITDPELLIEIADLAMMRAKELKAAAKPAKGKGKGKKDNDVAMPEEAVAAAVG